MDIHDLIGRQTICSRKMCTTHGNFFSINGEMPLHANGVGGGSSATKIWLHALVRAIDTGAVSECDSKSKLTTTNYWNSVLKLPGKCIFWPMNNIPEFSIFILIHKIFFSFHVKWTNESSFPCSNFPNCFRLSLWSWATVCAVQCSAIAYDSRFFKMKQLRSDSSLNSRARWLQWEKRNKKCLRQKKWRKRERMQLQTSLHSHISAKGNTHSGYPSSACV